MKTLFNTFAYNLDKSPIMNIQKEKPIYSNGDFHIYEYYYNHFVYTYKNLVITERAGINKQIIDDLVFDNYTAEGCKYLLFDRPKAMIQTGIETAKKAKFTVE